MHLKCIIFTGRSAIIENDWKKIELGPARLFFPIHFCVTCQALPNVSSLYHPAEFSIIITECCQLKLEIIGSCTHTLLSTPSCFIPQGTVDSCFFYDKRSPILTRTLIFSNIKKFPSQKKKHNKITFKHLLFLKGGEDLPSDLLMTFYCTRQQHCIWKHKTSLRTFLASGLKWLFWH